MIFQDTRWIEVTPNLANFSGVPYASGDALGGINTLTVPLSGTMKTGYVRSVRVYDKDKQNAAMSVIFFSANPSASTFTDNSAMAIATADLAKLRPYVAILSTDWKSFSANSVASVSSLQSDVNSAATSVDASTN